MISRAKILEAAEEHVQSGRLDEAIAEYTRLLDGGANDVSISLIIGDLYLKLGRRNEALKVFVTNMVGLDKRGAFAQALALAKKIHKIDPANGEIRERMGDLYGRLGFEAEARTEYAEAARLFLGQKDVHGRISVYEKLAALDRTDLESRLTLARLLAAEDKAERAAAELNAIADIQSARGEDAAAERTLREALVLGPTDARTVSGLVRLLRRAGRRDQAIAVLAAALDAAPRLEFLLLLGDLRAEAGDSAGARECFTRILDQDPENAGARGHLGRLEIQAGQPDRAFALLEPLISQAIRSGRTDRAIGWLGLILMSGALHLLSLEKLASVFRFGGRKAELEIVGRLLLREYRKRGLDADRERILAELSELSPRDAAVAEERRALRRLRLGLANGEDGPTSGAAPPMSASNRDLIKASLAKADRHIEQGLIPNARRILENLQLLFPGDPRIELRLDVIRDKEEAATEVDIPVAIRRILSLESETADEMPEMAPAAPPAAAPEEEQPRRPHKTVSLEDIFGGSDLTAAAFLAEGGPARGCGPHGQDPRGAGSDGAGFLRPAEGPGGNGREGSLRDRHGFSPPDRTARRPRQPRGPLQPRAGIHGAGAPRRGRGGIQDRPEGRGAGPRLHVADRPMLQEDAQLSGSPGLGGPGVQLRAGRVGGAARPDL
jgi:tetratricopeptide (TPR) repeat protein